MANDPLAQVDQTVLDVIEHSPTGAVPHTPTYQDALRRLVAAHQVYPSADYKSGHVTVRSLAAKQCFYAPKLEAFLSGAASETELEGDAGVFSRYVASVPGALRAKAEETRGLVVAKRLLHRAKHGGDLAHDPVHALLLVPGTGAHPGLPGNYLYGEVQELADPARPGAWALRLHDLEAGTASIEVATRLEVLAKLEEVVSSAPFQLSELAALGFRLN
jgi:hypothetical protein